MLSRLSDSQTEWSLLPSVVEKMWTRFGMPEVDLFAATDNHKLPIFCALTPHRKVWHTDAFTCDWCDLAAYAFPPPALLGKVLEKVRNDCARSVLLVAPFWHSQLWFHGLLQLLVGQPPVLPTPPDLLRIPGSGETASLSGPIAPDCVAAIRQSLLDKGFSAAAAEVAYNFRSTVVLYSGRLQNTPSGVNAICWVDPTTAPVGKIADFLLYLFNMGRQVSSIKGYRSAIASIHGGFTDGSSVSSSPDLLKLVKGLFLKRPPVRSLVPP